MSADKEAVYFIDSNVWLYAFLPKQDQVKEHTASKLIHHKYDAIVVSTQVVNEIVTNLIKNNAMNEDDIRKLILGIYQDYQVIRIDEKIQVEASRLRERYSISHWDSLIISAALYSGASILYSEDMQHGLVVNEQLTIINPFK